MIAEVGLQQLASITIPPDLASIANPPREFACGKFQQSKLIWKMLYFIFGCVRNSFTWVVLIVPIGTANPCFHRSCEPIEDGG